ncbi:hypothetical protein ACIBSV_50445 [Embleya sp. NPDC050154]|uniref:hypothetical protein n=1 Tax=Embleya sp. NPDC050154 TaxID=3363988 RepID=UPI0037A77636
MRTVYEPETEPATTETAETALIPLLLDLARPANTAIDIPGLLALDEHTQVSFLDGRPLIEVPGIEMATKSTFSTDGNSSIAIDEGADDL